LYGQGEPGGQDNNVPAQQQQPVADGQQQVDPNPVNNGNPGGDVDLQEEAAAPINPPGPSDAEAQAQEEALAALSLALEDDQSVSSQEDNEWPPEDGNSVEDPIVPSQAMPLHGPGGPEAGGQGGQGNNAPAPQPVAADQQQVVDPAPVGPGQPEANVLQDGDPAVQVNPQEPGGEAEEVAAAIAPAGVAGAAEITQEDRLYKPGNLKFVIEDDDGGRVLYFESSEGFSGRLERAADGSSFIGPVVTTPSVMQLFFATPGDRDNFVADHQGEPLTQHGVRGLVDSSNGAIRRDPQTGDVMMELSAANPRQPGVITDWNFGHGTVVSMMVQSQVQSSVTGLYQSMKHYGTLL